MVGLGGLPDLRIGFGAGRTLEIFEDHNGYLGSSRRLEEGAVSREAGAACQENCRRNCKTL